MKNAVYDYVTERMLKALDEKKVPWQKPWTGGEMPMNLVSKKEYRGINCFLLGFSPYASPYWLTAKQAKDKGGSVKKGEEGSMVVFYKTLVYGKNTDDEKKIPLLRYYKVFNTEQCEGIEIPPPKDKKTFVPIEEAARVVREMPKRPNINHGGGRAFYSSLSDSIGMPPAENFISPEEYYSTIFHELVHSTGHEGRLKRFDNTTDHIFGSQSYSKEELVAEMGAAFLSAHLGIEQKTIENSAAYIRGWHDKISADPKLIVQAANQAQKAADFILNIPKEEAKPEPEKEAE